MIVSDPSKPFSRSASTVLAPASPPPTTTMSADCSGIWAPSSWAVLTSLLHEGSAHPPMAHGMIEPMTHEVRGVVSLAKGEPVSMQTILVPDPGPGEALVQVQACGVCHTDLHYREGGINDEFPFLLGHEAAGIVESVGDGVTDVAPGDFVILNWRAVCGQCRACRRGRPWYCFNTH